MSRRAAGEGSVYQRADGRWEASVSGGIGPDGRRRRRKAVRATQRDALTALKIMVRERDAGLRADLGRMPTVGAWLDEWLASIELGLRASTVAFYRSMLTLYLRPHLGRARLDELRPEHVSAAYRAMLARGLSPATVGGAHRTLRAALRAAVAQGRLVRNPLDHVRPPKLRTAEIVPLTVDEARRVLAVAATRRNGARCAVALALGLRQGEALGLRWGDIDLAGGTLTVRRALQRRPWQHGCVVPESCGRARDCPRRTRPPLTGEPKTAAGERTISLPEPLVAVLREHRRAQAEERLSAGELWSDEGWVFGTVLGGHVDQRNDARAWAALLRDANVRHVRLHDARHTAATMLLVQGVDSRTAMDILGWSRSSMAQRYQHVVPELRREAARRMGEALWPQAGGAS